MEHGKPTLRLCCVIALMVVSTIGVTPGAIASGQVAAERANAPQDNAVAIENEFIRIRVNSGPQEAGRFAVDTTGGDPSRSADNQRVLIYGSREPWTSYTTIVVDGRPWIFGGETQRRAGFSASATKVLVHPQIRGDRIVAVALAGDVEITQQLGFARSPTTRVKDAALIGYTITNRGSTEHTVGLRIVLDTMLGSNDGAPLRAGGHAISTATQLIGGAIPEYWQAFDSLADPAVISQGTLRARDLTPPDRIEMVDWGTLADNPWTFAFPAGSDFTRRGEAARDTAVALYWEPSPLAPGQSRTYSTLYGVGGVSLSPAALSLGLTAPAEVDFQYDDQQPFSVVAYIENSGGFESRGTRLKLTLSEGLALAEGASTVRLGSLQPGQTTQVVWRVLTTGKATGTLQITATATSDNLETNRVSRDILVNSPPQLAVDLIAPDALSVTSENRYTPNPFRVRTTVSNFGAQSGKNLVAMLDLPDGLVPDGGTSTTRVTDRIEPDGSVDFTWDVRAIGMPTGSLPIILHVTAAGAKPIKRRVSVNVPDLVPELRVHPVSQTVPALTDGRPTLVPISVKLVPARNFTGATLSLAYDPTVLEPLYISRGEGFVDGGRLLSPWSEGRSLPGSIANIGGQRSGAPALSAAEASLFTVVFMVKKPGKTEIALDDSAAVQAAEGAVEFRTVNGRITVE